MEENPDGLDSEGSADQTFTVPEPATQADEVVPVLLPYAPDSLAETTRKTGLAWTAGIVFFGSVAFMLVLGWIADVVLGSSPWGIVVGIVLGSVIGFMQFFRITSRILSHPTAETPPRTVIPEAPAEDRDRYSA
jgi:F0F1-type ATP synthase assembly protein I